MGVLVLLQVKIKAEKFQVAVDLYPPQRKKRMEMKEMKMGVKRKKKSLKDPFSTVIWLIS
jgi:hypothetical protein